LIVIKDLRRITVSPCFWENFLPTAIPTINAY